MTKYTPGPWEVIHDIGIKVHRSEPIPKGARYAVAQVGVGRGDPQDEANARLIAAAPDLLEALKELADADPHLAENPRYGAPVYARAYAAIKKAEGR